MTSLFWQSHSIKMTRQCYCTLRGLLLAEFKPAMSIYLHFLYFIVLHLDFFPWDNMVCIFWEVAAFKGVQGTGQTVPVTQTSVSLTLRTSLPFSFSRTARALFSGSLIPGTSRQIVVKTGVALSAQLSFSSWSTWIWTVFWFGSALHSSLITNSFLISVASLKVPMALNVFW